MTLNIDDIVLEDRDITPEVMMRLLSGDTTLTDLKEEKLQKKNRKQMNKRQGRLQNEIEQRLVGLSTRTLLRMRQFFYDGELDTITQFVIRKILSTREHVPSGKERKNIRRSLAKKNHGGSKSRNR